MVCLKAVKFEGYEHMLHKSNEVYGHTDQCLGEMVSRKQQMIMSHAQTWLACSDLLFCQEACL